MSGIQISIDLRETAWPHVVRRHILAEDIEHAKAWITQWNGLASTRTGRTEVVIRDITHPDRLPEEMAA